MSYQIDGKQFIVLAVSGNDDGNCCSLTPCLWAGAASRAG